MKIWLDDIREPPVKGNWVWMKSGEEVIEALKNTEVKEISFDHDLGEDRMTGYDVAKWIEEQASQGLIDPIIWKVHSANPVGKKNIEAAMKSAEKFWISVEDDEDEDEDIPRRGKDEWR